MSNAMLCHPIWSDDALLYGGAWGNAPLANMQTEALSNYARSTNLTNASTQFDADHGAPVVARAIAYVRHNMSKAAKIRMRASSRCDFGLLAPVAPDISKAPWTDINTPVVAAVAGPDGELSGYSINDNNGADVEARYVPLATSGGNGAKSFGIWIKKGTATVSVVEIYDATASADRLFATITWVSTTPGTPVCATGSYVSQQVAQVGLWYYLVFTTTSITAANDNRLYLYGASTTAAATGTTLYAFPGYCTRNLITSSDISGGSWSDLVSPTVSVTTGPLGAQDGYVILDNTAGDYEGRFISIDYASDGVKPLNVWVKKGSSAKSTVVVSDQTAVAARLSATITWVGTAPGTPVMSTGTYLSQTASTLYPGWYLLRFLTTSVTAANDNILLLLATSTTITETGTTAYALPWTEDDSVCYEDLYNSGWIPAYRQAYAGPANLLDAYQALGSWSVGNSPIVRRGYADPLGGQRAFVVEDDNGAGTEYIYQAAAALSDGTKAFRVYMKAGTAAAPVFALFDNTVGVYRHQVTVTWSAAGVPTLSTTDGAGTLSTPVDCGNGWWCLSATATGVVSVHANVLLIAPAGLTAASTGTVYVFQPWAEDAATFADAILQTGEPGYTDGKVTQTSLTDGYPFDLIHVLPSNVLAQYWRTEIDDTTNTTAYIQIGRFAVAFGYEASLNIVPGARVGWVTDSSASRVDGGSRSVNVRRPWREAVFGFEMLEDDEVMVRHQDFMRRVGIDQQIIWIEEPDATLHAHRKNYLAQLRELQGTQKPIAMFNSQAYAVCEVI